MTLVIELMYMDMIRVEIKLQTSREIHWTSSAWIWFTA